MAKILVIPDVHGSNFWEKAILSSKGLYDKVIFLGDYVDSFVFSDEDILENLKKIIDYKLSNMDTTILLLGNHDIPYIYDERMFMCSGYRFSMKIDLGNIFRKNLSIFNICKEEDGILFSHAGIIDPKDLSIMKTFEDKGFDEIPLSVIKDLSKVGGIRGGSHDFGGPFWADMQELIMLSKDIKKDQVVGHTSVRYPKLVNRPNASSLFFTDAGQKYCTLLSDGLNGAKIIDCTNDTE